jgi:hypothetical protein
MPIRFLFLLVYKMAKRNRKEKLSAEDEIIREALERYEDCETSCSEIYKDAVDDMRFTTGDQWASDTTRDRIDRPCLVDNRLAASVHQVCNSQRMNRPMIKVSAKKENSDDDVVDIINGFLRHIQYQSDSESAVDWAFDCAVRGGIGWFRIKTEYDDDESFDQTITIDRIDNLENVKIPFHLCHEIDCRDMPFAFVESTMSRDEFETRWPDANPTNWKTDVTQAGWLTDKTLRIAEYFKIEETKTKLHRLSDGKVSREKPQQIEGLPPPPDVVASRDVIERRILWYKLTAGAILEQGEFPGNWIPLIPVIGEEVLVGGKRKFLSFIKHAKDPQKMRNYWVSAIAERIALASKAKWVVASTQIENYENEWVNSNRSNNTVLHYDPVVEGGVLVPPPQPAQPAQADMALIQAANDSTESIKATLGMFDASLGTNGPEKSGKAIQARQNQSDNGTYHIFDNCAKAMRHAGRIIVDLIPEVIDTERAIKILGEDQKTKIVKVNQEFSTDGKIYDVRVGEYDVLVETGPSFLSKQQETASNLRDLSQNDPVLIQSTRDLVMKYLGMPSDVIERVTKTIPQNLLSDQDKQKPVPFAQVQQMAAEWQAKEHDLDQIIQKMMADVEDLQKQVKDKSVAVQAHLMGTQIKAQAEIEKAHIDNAHSLGMAAHAHMIDNNPAVAGVINDLAARLAQLEQTLQSSTAPAPNAESQSQGAPNVNA